jgi:hypothetical protein
MPFSPGFPDRNNQFDRTISFISIFSNRVVIDFHEPALGKSGPSRKGNVTSYILEF